MERIPSRTLGRPLVGRWTSRDVHCLEMEQLPELRLHLVTAKMSSTPHP